MLVGLDLYLATRLWLTFVHRKDWSTVQADKYLNEIRSLLGNFFMRITSNAIRSRLSSLPEPTPSLTEISSLTFLPGNTLHEHNRRVLTTLENLGSSVRSRLEGLDVAEALSLVVLCLREVRIPF
jgi:methionyl-tRNA synthetase